MKCEPLTDEQRQKLLELGSDRLGEMCQDVDGDCPMYDLFKRDCVFPGFPCYAVNAGDWKRYLQEAKDAD